MGRFIGTKSLARRAVRLQAAPVFGSPARLCTLAMLACVATAAAATPPSSQRNFVACPILRDTKTVPCWLADYDGQRYYLGIQVDAGAEWYPPYLGHKALIEGTVTDEEICGGKVLKPLKVSVLPELDASCNTILPAVDAYTVPFAPRGPGPRAKLEDLRKLGVRRRAPAREERPLQPPFQTREFVVYYDFDSEIANRYTREIASAMRYATAVHASRVEVKAYRGSSALSNGQMLAEKPYLAQRRATRLAETLKQIGVPADAVAVSWKKEADAGDGLDDWQERRATIVVKP
jgi:outer membrane protein OmpA-like peptidoglycan-associated protein